MTENESFPHFLRPTSTTKRKIHLLMQNKWIVIIVGLLAHASHNLIVSFANYSEILLHEIKIITKRALPHRYAAYWKQEWNSIIGTVTAKALHGNANIFFPSVESASVIYGYIRIDWRNAN